MSTGDSPSHGERGAAAPLKVMDLFCGTGGFSKGFENTGYCEIVYGIDILKPSVDTFRLNHRSALGIAGDIRRTSRSDVAERTGLSAGQVDVIIGGPPCQGFSSIRPNRSTSCNDPRNNLFEEFAAYVGFFRPTAFVLENVVGLATHNEGRDLDAVQEAFDRLGYETDWRILNAAHFGVPQKRERLIVLGAQQGIRVQWPTPTHGGKFRTIGFNDSSRLLRPGECSLSGPHLDELAQALTVADAIDDLPPVASGGVATAYLQEAHNTYQKARRAGNAKLTWHSSTRHTPKMLEIIRHAGPNISSIPAHLITSGFSSCYSRLDASEPAPTITVNFVHPASNKCIHPSQDRALTPREGARLQSFDDTFLFAPTSRNLVARQIGNAVPPLLGQIMGEALVASIGALSC